jgi:hypothetical protein
MNSPTSLVLSFISDYYNWNKFAFGLSRGGKDNSRQVIELAEKKYDELLRKYCLPGFKGVAISFGSESIHEPEQEVVVSEEVIDSEAIIRTIHSGRFSFVSKYEYRLVKKSSRWYLEAVDYVDSDGKYPSL